MRTIKFTTVQNWDYVHKLRKEIKEIDQSIKYTRSIDSTEECGTDKLGLKILPGHTNILFLTNN